MPESRCFRAFFLGNRRACGTAHADPIGGLPCLRRRISFPLPRHCEERSDVAIPLIFRVRRTTGLPRPAASQCRGYFSGLLLFGTGSCRSRSAGAVLPALQIKNPPFLLKRRIQNCSIRYAERILATGRAVLLDCRQEKSIRPEFAPGQARYAERKLATGRAVLLDCR